MAAEQAGSAAAGVVDPATGCIALDAPPTWTPSGRARARLLDARRVLTVCHRDPEADALGSALGLALALEDAGHAVTPVCADVVPAMYGFMPRIDRFRAGPDPDARPTTSSWSATAASCSASVGSSTTTPSCSPACPSSTSTITAPTRGFGASTGSTPARPPTCEMVTLLLPRLGVPLDALDGDIAADLMAGLVIDTATFQHPNATPRTLRVAGELRAAGAPLSDISRRIYRTKPNAQLQLFGRVLARLETAPTAASSGRRLPRGLAEAAAVPAMSEGLIDLLAQSEAGDVAILFKDQGDQTRISVRTRDGGVDAIALTGAFGGGGHARAAGATIDAAARRWRAPTRPGAGGAPRRLSCRDAADGSQGAAGGPRIDGILVVGKPHRPHLARRGRHRAPAHRRPAGGPRRHAGPVRRGRPAGLPGPRHAHGGVPPRGREGLPRGGRPRRLAPRPTTSTAS